MKKILVNNNVFWFNVEWILWTAEEFVKFMQGKNFEISLHDTYDGSTYIDSPANAYLYLKDVSDDVLLHECIHIIQHILQDKWITTWMENTEVLAYNVDWLYRQLLLQYYKLKNDKRRKTYK